MTRKNTDILIEIRERGYRNGATGAECARLSDAADADIPCLLKAVEAALELHVPIVRRERWPPTCKYDNHRWPCPEVEAITAALAGRDRG
jgi:hypothetical protein